MLSILNLRGCAHIALIGCATVLVGCSSSRLSRDQAADLVRARLSSENVVSQIRVFGVALRQLIDGGHILVAMDERDCGLGPRCSDVRPGGALNLFSSVDGEYYRSVDDTDNVLTLTLRTPLNPSKIEITGIAQDNLRALVEFTFSYDSPAAIAGLNTTATFSTFMGVQPASYVKTWPGMADLLGPHAGRWTMQRYDDGWRIVR